MKMFLLLSRKYQLWSWSLVSTAQKMKFSIKDFFSKRGQIRKKTADLVTFTEESLNGKFHFLCSEGCETFDAKENVSMS